MTRLRKMMLEERRNFSADTIRWYIRNVEDFARRFNCRSKRLGPRHNSRISSSAVPEAEVVARYSYLPPRGPAVLLHQDAQEGLEHPL